MRGLADWLPSGGEISHIEFGYALSVICFIYTHIQVLEQWRSYAACRAISSFKTLSPRPVPGSYGATLPQQLTPIRGQGREQTLLQLTQLPLPKTLHEQN